MAKNNNSQMRKYILLAKDKGAYEERIKNRDRVLLISSFYSIGLNLSLAILKLLLFLFTKSISILGDSINNLSDSISSLVFLIGTKLSKKPADKEHPYGHGRIEYISGFLISFFVLAMGVSFMKLSFDRVIKEEALYFSNLSMLLIFISIVVKLYMSVYFDGVSKALNSLPAKAQSKDYIGDALITAVILISMSIYKVFSIKIDAYLGLLISLYVMYTGYHLIMENISEMIGKVPVEFIEKLKERILSYEDVIRVHNIVASDFGPGKIYISANVDIDKSNSLVKTHEIIDRIEKEIRQEFSCILTLHVDPVENKEEK